MLSNEEKYLGDQTSQHVHRFLREGSIIDVEVQLIHGNVAVYIGLHAT